MSKLEHAGDSSTASPRAAAENAVSTAACMDAAWMQETREEVMADSIDLASLPINTTARARFLTGSASGEKSCSLPSQPAMSMVGTVMPFNAATVEPTLVPFESS